MGRESRRDAEDGGRRHRRTLRQIEAAAPPDARMRALESPSLSRTLPHRGKLQLQRSDEGALRGMSNATTSSSASSQAAMNLTMPPAAPPPPPLRLTRAQTIASSRRHRDPVVYDDDRLALAPLRRSQTEISPARHARRPRLQDEFLSTPSESASASTEDTEDDSEEEEDDDDDDDDDVDDDDDDDEHQEDDEVSELSSEDTVEVIEEADDEAEREINPRHAQRNGHIGHADERNHRRTGHRDARRSPSTNETRTRRHHHYPADNHKSPARRSSLTQSDVGRSPPTRRRHKVSSVIEDSRPPVSSHRSAYTYTSRRASNTANHVSRSSKHGRKSTEIIHHETPPRRSNTVASGRSSNRSSSRRPASILGSLFGGPPPLRSSPDKPAKIVECVICMGEIPSTKAPKLKCGHRMCHTCLQRSFKLSVNDPQHMPPKCCTQDYIPLKHVERLFDNSFKKTWNRKFAEYSTRNRIYCPSRKCGEWIKPSHIRREEGRKVARCGRCKTKVCGACNGKWHSSVECPRDEETNQFLQQAKEEGWQRCFGCKVMVELKEGCNHMTCRCGAEFCMICGTKWKNCDCPWFNYETIDTDRAGHMIVPEPTMRPDMRDIFASDGLPGALELRSPGGLVSMPAPPPPPGTYEEEMHMRRVQEQRDADLARRMQLYDESDEEYDERGRGGDMLGVASSSSHHASDEYRRARRRMAAPSPPPAAPIMLDRGPGYVGEVNRARGVRATSQERRLADRFSESRYGMGPRTGMGSPMSAHGFSPMRVPPPPVGLPPMGMAMSMPMSMSVPPPPPVPMMPPHSMRPEMYHSVHGTPPEHMMGVPWMPPFYGDDYEGLSPRSRRPGRDDLEPPRSSTLAGLTGLGSGMNRVYEWRNFVEPGVPEDERATGRA
ncbi:ATP-dependent RNA helicase DEAH12, chloroplastic [Paramyrothecium foliicola]|nr:ATP-dependent RNA helicase DEAH12, chloroplastic [Paramyrothecium foliicola]